MVVVWANTRHATPHAIGRGSAPPTARPIGGGGFKSRCSPRSNPVACGPHAYCPEEARPSARGARALVWCCEPLSRERGQRHRHVESRLSADNGTARFRRVWGEYAQLGRSAHCRDLAQSEVARAAARGRALEQGHVRGRGLPAAAEAPPPNPQPPQGFGRVGSRGCGWPRSQRGAGRA